MYTSISIQTRPNLSVKFWSTRESADTPSLYYIKTQYVDTGKLKKSDSIISDDGLSVETRIQWASEKDYLDFSQDPTIISSIINPLNEYAEKNGVVVKSLNTQHKMVNTQGPDPYPNLVTPDSWASVEEFAEWWFKNGMPMKFQEGSEVFLSDDATSIALFRQGRFQVELYLIHPHPKVPVHEHPDVEVIKVRLGAGKYPYMSNTLRNGGSHGAGLRLEAEDKGYPLLAIQHWLTREPTTIASMWKGDTVGPKQESLIKRFNPTAYVVEGYADITRSQE
jgi:hypothetical protein